MGKPIPVIGGNGRAGREVIAQLTHAATGIGLAVDILEDVRCAGLAEMTVGAFRRIADRDVVVETLSMPRSSRNPLRATTA